jgi:hypothetical protein
MKIFGGKASGDGDSSGIFAERSRNGNVRDTSAEHKHEALMSGHGAAVNDLRPSSHVGKHRK